MLHVRFPMKSTINSKSKHVTCYCVVMDTNESMLPTYFRSVGVQKRLVILMLTQPSFPTAIQPAISTTKFDLNVFDK